MLKIQYSQLPLRTPARVTVGAEAGAIPKCSQLDQRGRVQKTSPFQKEEKIIEERETVNGELTLELKQPPVSSKFFG